MLLPGDKAGPGPHGPGIVSGPLYAPLAVLAGEHRLTAKYEYVDTNLKRYVPAKGDYVVGVIQKKAGEAYKVRLQDHSDTVRLSQLAFPGATRKNRPNLARGDVVYGRISAIEPEVEMECVDSNSGQAMGFGQLKEGTLIHVSLGYARALLFDGHFVLQEAGKRSVYEVAIGVNGTVWIKGSDAKSTFAVCELIKSVESTGKRGLK